MSGGSSVCSYRSPTISCSMSARTSSFTISVVNTLIIFFVSVLWVLPHCRWPTASMFFLIMIPMLWLRKKRWRLLPSSLLLGLSSWISFPSWSMSLNGSPVPSFRGRPPWCGNRQQISAILRLQRHRNWWYVDLFSFFGYWMTWCF